MTTTPGPRTEAGKRLLGRLDHEKACIHPHPNYVTACWACRDILAIEAEARADVDDPDEPDAVRYLGFMVLHAEQVHGCDHTTNIRSKLDIPGLLPTEARADVDGLVARPSLEDAMQMEAGARALAARALHRWRHPSFKLGEGKCRCEQDAEMAMSILLTDLAGDKAEAPETPARDVT